MDQGPSAQRTGGASLVELRVHEGGVTLSVRVQPRASRNSIGGARGGSLVVRLTAPPVDGAANAALARLLGRVFLVAPSAVRIRTGTAGRTKRVSVDGVDLATARERLRALEVGGERSSEGRPKA